ncbi:cobalamin biosynthesis protein [Hylemonella sp. W303a]|uniref:cobalamin biosynthesis protein n=1 Tax=Hylemonella sp. W303a TaxID=3389873 RepID=UPI00396B2A33
MNDVTNPVIAGIGLRQRASVQALQQVLSAALAAAQQRGSAVSLAALASAADKCQHPALLQLAREWGLPLHAVALERLHMQQARPSAQVPERYGARSVAEASALAVAGPGAVLACVRQVSADGTATAAIAFPSSEHLMP